MAITTTFIGEQSDTNNRTTYTFTGISFGAAAADRYIVVFIVSNDSDASSITSCSIGSATATLTTVGTPGFGSVRPVRVAVAALPTGTDGAISYSHSSQMTGSSIVIYRVTGLKSTTPIAVAEAVVGGTSVSSTIDAQRGGLVLGLTVSATDDSPGITHTWTGLTEAWDSYLDTNEGSSAYKIFTDTTFDAEVSVAISNSESIWLGLVSFAAYDQFTNPGNVYLTDTTYATCAATSGDLVVDLSIDGGATYGTALTQTFTVTDEVKTYGTGSTELWGLAPSRAEMINGLFRLRITHGDYSQVYGDFGFATGTEILTGIEVNVTGKYNSATLSIDHIQAKIYYGTSILPIQVGSMAFASNGRKNGEAAENGSGVLVFYDGVSWIASDSGQTVTD